MRSIGRDAACAVTAAVLSVLLVGCTGPDLRLVEDQRSCLNMGHTQDTPTFRTCMADLNDRRCAHPPSKGGTSHVITADCTRVN